MKHFAHLRILTSSSDMSGIIWTFSLPPRLLIPVVERSKSSVPDFRELCVPIRYD